MLDYSGGSLDWLSVLSKWTVHYHWIDAQPVVAQEAAQNPLIKPHYICYGWRFFDCWTVWGIGYAILYSFRLSVIHSNFFVARLCLMHVVCIQIIVTLLQQTYKMVHLYSRSSDWQKLIVTHCHIVCIILY